MNIYVGNLSGDVSEDDLRGAFAAFGEVISVNIVRDRVSGESRGFGFVQMPSRNEALAAISGMNDKDLKGQNVNVAEARPKAQSRRSGGDRRGGFGDKRRGGRGGFGGDRGRRRNGSGGSRGRRRY